MAMIIRSGNVGLGFMTLPEKKKPSIIVVKDNAITCYGTFNSENSAKSFIKELYTFFNVLFNSIKGDWLVEDRDKYE